MPNSDWDAVQRVVEEERGRKEEWQQAADRWEREAHSALSQRLSKFAADLSGRMHVSIEEQTAPGRYPDMVVLMGIAPFAKAGPDAVAVVTVAHEPYFRLELEGGSEWKQTYTLEALIDQLVAEAARIVGSSLSGRRPPLGGTYAQYKVRRQRNSESAAFWSGIYGTIGLIVGVVSGLGTWAAIGSAWGLFGVLLGWIPGLIVGVVAGLFWGVIAIGVILFVLYALRG